MMPPQFRVPEVEDNDDGWGPLTVPDHLAGIPYAPFGKGDKVGKISDFTQAGSKYGGTSRSPLQTLSLYLRGSNLQAMRSLTCRWQVRAATAARNRCIELLPQRGGELGPPLY